MAIQVQEGFNAIKSKYKDITNIFPVDKVRMANIVNSRIYNFVIKSNPEDWIKENTIFVQPNVDTYASPTNFQHHKDSDRAGLFFTNGGSTYLSLEFDTKVNDFTVGQTITQPATSASGTLDQIEVDGAEGFMKLSNVDGDFETDESITNGLTATADVVSLKAYDESDRALDLTHKSSPYTGYFTRGSNYIITPLPKSNAVLLDRYFEKAEQITKTDLTDNFVEVNVDDGQYIELIRDLLFIEYGIFNSDEKEENNGNIRSQPVLTDFFNSNNKEPNVFIFDE